MQHTITRLLKVSFVVFFFMIFSPASSVFAASTTLSVSPSEGTFDKEFTVNVVVDGHGDVFNAAQATASLSAQLAIKEVVLGDCGFSFITTPSSSDLSFSGVLLGKKAQKCTVYSATLIPIEKGTGTLSFPKATVRKYGDASNVLSSIKNGSYELTGTVKDDSLKVPTPTGDNYTVIIKLINTSDQPASSQVVSLTPAEAENSFKSTTDKSGNAKFENVKKGVYVIGVEGQKETKILNINGSNHVITFSMKISATSKYFIYIATSILLAIFLMGVIGYFIKKKRNK